jgi:hypothetical protein
LRLDIARTASLPEIFRLLVGGGGIRSDDRCVLETKAVRCFTGLRVRLAVEVTNPIPWLGRDISPHGVVIDDPSCMGTGDRARTPLFIGVVSCSSITDWENELCHHHESYIQVVVVNFGMEVDDNPYVT